MATEADLPEPLAISKKEGEIIYQASDHLDSTADETSSGELKKFQGAHNVPPEAVESLGERKKIQAANDVGAEAINTVIKVNVETPESDRFLESPSAVHASIDDGSRVSKNSETEGVTLQAGNETLEDGKQMQNNTNIEVAGEIGTEKNKVTEDSEKKPDENNMSHDILGLAGTCLQTAQVEESNITIEEESLQEERIIDHVEVVGDQHVLVEAKSDEKEKSDPHSYEKDGTMAEENTDLLFNKQVVKVLEEKSEQNKDDLIHIPDPTVISLNRRVETVSETCNTAESTIEGKSAEEMRETSSTEVENKGETSGNLTDEVPEATKPSERVAEEKNEEEESMYEGAKDIVTSTTEIQSNEEATLKIREGDNEKLDKPSVTLATDASGLYEAESEAAEKLEVVFSGLCEEKSQDETEPGKNEMNHKNSIDTPAMQTDAKDIINKSLPEVEEQTEMTEKTAANDITSNETGEDYESPDQKGDCSFMKDEDALSVNEVLPAKEASSGGNRYEEESTVTVTKDSITDPEIIDAIEHSKSGMTYHEDSPEDLQRDKPEKQKLEGSLNVVAEEFNKAAEAITSVKETPIKSHEEILDKEMKSDIPHHTDAKVPLIELKEKTECAEVEAPNKFANDLHDIQAVEKEAGENEGKNLDEVFNSEPKGTIQEALEAYTKEEKHNEDAPEVCQSSNSTIFDQTSVEGPESTEQIPKASETDAKKLQEASGLDFEEKSVIIDDGENIDREMQKSREAWDVVTQETLAKSVDAETSVEVDNAVFPRDDKAEQNVHIQSPLEVAPELTGQDDSCIAEDNDKRNGITNEEVNDGTKITGSVAAINEGAIAGCVTHILPESFQKPNVESSEGIKIMAKQSDRENSREKVTEDNRCLEPESVEQCPAKNLEESTGEISEKSDTEEATESFGQETIKNIESPREIVYASTVTGDALQTEGRNLTPTEPSPEEKRNEDAIPDMAAEENGDDFEPADVKDGIENVTSKFEEDFKNISMKNEPEEELPQSFSTVSDKNDSLHSDADETPGVVEDGPSQNLEEALQIEENKNETGVKNDTEYSKTAMKEDLEKIAEISDASKIKENMASETSLEMDKKMEEDEIKKEESEQIYEDSNDGNKDEETEKHNIKEECSTTDNLPETAGEESLDSSKEDAKEEEETTIIQACKELKTASTSEDAEKQTLEVEMNADQSREVEEGKIEQSSKEDDTSISPASREVEEEKIERSSHEDEKVFEISSQGNDTCILPLSIEQELENSEGNVNKEEKSAGENTGQQGIEENKSRGLIAESESVEQSPVKNLEADKMEVDKSTTEIFGNSAESTGHEECTAEVLDTSQVKLVDNLQNDQNQLTATESSAVDKRNEDRGPAMMAEDDSNENELLAAKNNIENKPLIGQEDSQHILQENEPEENHEQSLSVRSNENEASISNADKIPCLMEALSSQDLNEAPWKEDTDKETEEKNDTEDNQIATEKNLELVTVPSDANKSTEGIVSELKSEKDQMLVQEEIKKEQSEELYDDSRNPSLLEPTEDKTPQGFEEGKEEDTPITAVCVELETSVDEDAKKQIREGISMERSKELEVEKVEQISKEDDITAKTSKQKECEITQIANEDEDTGSQNIEKVGADENKLEPFARVIDNDDPLVKESEENKKGKELHEDSNDVGKDDETDKHNIKEECSTTGNLPETIGEESLQSSKEDEKEEETPKIQASEELKTTSASEDVEEQNLQVEKNVDRSREVEEERIERSSQEDDMIVKMSKQSNDTYISLVSIEQETLENSEGNKDKEEKTEGVNNREQSLEESNSGDLTPESVEHSPVKSLEDDKMREDKSTGELFKNSETSGVAEIATHGSSTTIESTTEIPDTSPLKQVDRVGNEVKKLTSTEASAEEKRNEDRSLFLPAEENSNDNEPIGAKDNIEKKSSVGEEDLQHFQQENEPEEKHEHFLLVVSDKNEPSSSGADKTPCLMEVETSQDLDGAPPKEENDKETEEKNDTEDNKIEMENHEIAADSSDASKSTEGLDLKSEEDKMLVDNETKEEESKELYGDTKNAVIFDTEEIVQLAKQDTSSLLVEGHVEENSKEDESIHMKSNNQVDESNSIIEETELASSAEETVSETLKDREESIVNPYPLEKMKESEAETQPKEIYGSLIEEPANVWHMLNEETEEEIKEKVRKTEEGTTVDDLDSAPVTVVAEEKSLQEAEPEDKKQEESFAPAFEEKDTAETETKEIMLDSVAINVKPNDTSDLGEKRDDEIPTIADKAGKITEDLIKESAMTSHTSNKETEEEIKTPEEITIGDSDSASVAVVAEAKGLQEAESEDTPITEVYVEPDTVVSEDAEKQITEGISVEQSEELEVQKVEQISKEGDITAKTSKQEECEITQTANGDKDRGSQNLEKEGADENKLELFARGIDNDEPLVKESEENKQGKQLHEDSKDGGKDEETDKHNIKAECSTTGNLPETTGEVSLQSSKEDEKEEETPKIQAREELKTTSASEDVEEQTLEVEKNVDQSREVEEEKIEQSSQEDDMVAKMSKQKNDNYISPVSNEQESLNNSEGDKEEKTGVNNRELSVEESNSGGLTPESVEHSPVKNLEDDKMSEDKSTGEIFKNSKTSEVAEIAAHESNTTIKSTTEIPDTSPLKQDDRVRNEEMNLISTEASAEEKRNEDRGILMLDEEKGNDNEPIGAKDNIEKKSSIGEEDLQHFQQEIEPEEKYEPFLLVLSEENEPFSSCADKTPRLMEIETYQDLDGAPQKEENEKDKEEKNDTEYNEIEMENLEIVAESSDASKCTEVLDLKSEEDKMVVGNEIKEKESKELYEDEKNAVISDSEEMVQLSEQNASSSLVEGHAEENSKEDESTHMKPKDQVDESNSFIEETEAASSAEETVSETLKDGEESNVNSYPSDNMKESGAETLPKEANGSLIEESSSVSHTINKETEEEIKEKVRKPKEGPTVDLDSAPVTVVTEERSLLEAEPEDKRKVESFATAFEEKDTAETETKEIMIDSKAINVKPDDTYDLGEKRDDEIPTIADKAGKITDGLIKESALASHTSNKETEEEIKAPEEITIRDSDSVSVAVVTEAKGLLEAESEDTPITEVCVEPETVVGEDAEKQIKEGNSVEQSKELEVEKVEHISKEDDITAKTSKLEECETTQTTNGDEETRSHNIDKGGGDENKLELFAKGINNYDPSVKGSEENEHGKQLHEDSNEVGNDDETDKHNIKEECSTTGNIPETIGEESLQSSKEDEKEEETPEIQATEGLKTTSASEDVEEQTLEVEKNVDQSREVEEEKIKQSSQEDDMVTKMSKQSNDTYISPVSIEQETLENPEEDKDKEEKTERVNNREQSLEESNSGELIPESVEDSPVKSLEDDKMREHKSTGEIFKNSETSEVAEIASHGSSTTIESTNLTSTEASAEEKRNEDRSLFLPAEENSNDNEPIGAKDNIEKKSSVGEEDSQPLQQENEPEEQHEHLLFVVSDKNEPSSSGADKTPCLMEVETSQDLDGAPWKGENEKETKEKNDTDDNKTEMENHEIVAESSDASKSAEVLDLKSEEDKMVVGNEIKEDESKELYEDTKNATICDTDEIVQLSVQNASSPLAEGHVEENSKEDESTHMMSKDQVDKSNSFIEETEAASSAEETVSETLKDGEDSNVNHYPLDNMKESEAETMPKETNGSLIEESANVSHMINKENEEEIKEKGRKTEEGTTVDDLDSAPVTVVSEEKCLQEAEPKDKKQVESFAPAFEEKDTTETETKEIMLDSITINVKPNDTSDLGEKRDDEIPTVADKDGNITEDLIEESAMASHTSNKETEEEIKAPEELTIGDSDSASVAVVTEAKGLQEAESEDKKQVESFGPALKDKGIAETEAKETMLEGVDIIVKPEATSDLGEKMDWQIPKGAVKAGETIDCKILNDAPHAGNGDQTEKITNDKPLEEISKDELMECSTMKLKEMELTTAEVSESVDKPPAENEVPYKNKETACVSQAIDDKEIKEKGEPQLEAEEHKEQNVNATTKAVILTEKEQDGGEQSNDSEDIKYMVVDEESAKELNDAVPSVGEITDEMQYSTLVCSEYNKAADLKEKAKTENPDIGEDSAREGEPLFERESEEQKVQDISIESSAKELNIDEPQDYHNKIDKASLTAETGTSSGQAEIDEKPVKAFHIDSDGPGLEATETQNCQEGKEVDRMKLEETSELASEFVMNDNGHAEREGVTLENRDAGETDETKIASEESKGQNPEEAEVGENHMVEIPHQVPTNNDGHAATEHPGPDKVEETKIVANEVKEIKEVSDAVYESKDRGTEEAEVGESQTVEKPDQLPTHSDDHTEKVYAAMENSDEDETKVVSISVDENNDQGAEETAETGRSLTMEKMDHIPSSYFENAWKESVATESPKVDEVIEFKVASDATYEFKDQNTEESTAEIPAVVKLDDQVPAANSERAEEETVTMQYLDAEETEETKIASSLACKSKEGSGDIDVIGENTTEEKLGAEKIEEACIAASDYSAQVIETVTENEVTADQAPSAEKSNSQLPTPTSTLVPKHKTTFSVEKIEEEKPKGLEKLEDNGLEDSSAAKPTEEVYLQTEGPMELAVSTLGFEINKDLQDSSTEAYKEEGRTPDETLQSEPRGIENKITSAESSSESKESKKIYNLESETSEKALQSKAVIHSPEEVTALEDTEFKEKHLIEAISEVTTEENQSEKTRETNEITKTEVSREEVKVEQKVAETCQPISLSEGMNKSLQEDGQKAKECRGDETNNAFKTSLIEETEKTTASPNIGRRDAEEDRYIEDSHQVSVENVITKESFPDEFERKEVRDSAIKLDPKSLAEESNYGSAKAETTTPGDEGLSMVIPQKENIKAFAIDRNIIQETRQLEQSPSATTEKQFQTPTLEQQGITEMPLKTEVGDLEPGNTKMIPSKAKLNLEGEQTAEESALMDSAKASLSDPLQKSRNVTMEVAKNVSEGREPTASTEENQTKEAEAIHELEAKIEEASSSDTAPVMIEASRDVVDVKVSHKKSHNILSGVGSKVKHSISKVKKAITCKSSHPKPGSPK